MQDNQNSISPWKASMASFAGFLLILGGVFHFLLGLAAIINGAFFVVGANYVYRFDITVWGWIHLILGIIIALVGSAILSGQLWGRVMGIIIAIISAIANFFFIPYYPLGAILIIALDIIIIWALASYGSREMTTG